MPLPGCKPTKILHVHNPEPTQEPATPVADPTDAIEGTEELEMMAGTIESLEPLEAILENVDQSDKTTPNNNKPVAKKNRNNKKNKE